MNDVRKTAARRRPTGTPSSHGAVALALCAALLSVGTPRPAHAQDAVDLWGEWVSWSGDDTEGFQPGYALGASYIADIGRPLDLGAEIGFARFEVEDLPVTVDELEISVQFRRWILGRSGPVRPFLAGRVGYTRLASDVEELRLEWNGVLGGLSLGVVFPTARTLSPMLSVEATRVKYGDASFFLEGTEIPDSGGDAWRFDVRAGLTFGSGWKRRPR